MPARRQRRLAVRPATGLAVAAIAVVIAGCGLAETTRTASGSPSATVDLVAQDLAFEPGSIELPAGAVVAIVLDNRDPGILHNVALYAADGGEALFRGPTFAGIATRAALVGPLPPGTFRFVCDVHPTMAGTVRVGATG